MRNPKKDYECGWVGTPSVNNPDDAWRSTIAASEFADAFEVNLCISKANVIIPLSCRYILLYQCLRRVFDPDAMIIWLCFVVPIVIDAAECNMSSWTC